MKNHHSGPRGPYRITPESFQNLLKKQTNWKKIGKLLNKLAQGGYTYQNYNGQTITAQPNLEALKLLIFCCWGKPTEATIDNTAAYEALEQFKRLGPPILLPKNDRTENTDDIKQVTTELN